MTSSDETVVSRQLGREPRGTWCVAARCSFGYPTVIATPSRLSSGEPFPTLFWLTCPYAVEAVGRLESAGEIERWATRLAADDALAQRMRAADIAYRQARDVRTPGGDACPTVGTAGQRDPLATKCLHAHVAAVLAGIDDPVGTAVLGEISRECADRHCESLTTTTT